MYRSPERDGLLRVAARNRSALALLVSRRFGPPVAAQFLSAYCALIIAYRADATSQPRS
jgi:hypothetical protein